MRRISSDTVEPLRIGLFHSSLPELDRKPGGVEVFVDRLADRLHGRGHQVRCFSYSGRPLGSCYEHVRLSPHSRATSMISRLALVPWQLNTLDTRGLDLMHLFGDDWFFLRRRVPTVRTFFGSAFGESMHATRLKRRFGMLVTSPLEILASRLASVSYSGLPGCPSFPGIAGSLPCAADIPDQLPAKRPGPPAIISVATWGGRKRGRLVYDRFLSAVRPAIPDAELWMVSDYCDPGPGVRWYRRPTDDELVSMLRRAWVFCLPSTYEGFGIPYLEAMANGVPVVATPNAGSEHLVRGAGAVVSDRDLGATILDVLRDEKRRERMQEAGRIRAREFSWERVIELHEAAYRSVLSAR